MRVSVRTSAVEILTDGTRVPVVGQRETTIFRGALDEILHPLHDIEPAEADPATDDDVQELVDRIVRRAQYVALREVLKALDDWRMGARENHDALGHRGEYRPCWESFATGDVRRMVSDAARELGVPDPCQT